MHEYDVELVLQQALEKYPDVKPRIISDNGTQFVSRVFKQFLSFANLTHEDTITLNFDGRSIELSIKF